MEFFKKKFNDISIGNLIIISLIVLSVFLAWQNSRLRNTVITLQNQIISIQPSPSPTTEPIESTQPSHTPEEDKSECRPSGCSGQICSDEDIVTTCEFKEEYACYANATCTRLESGECGWVMTDELKECISSATQNQAPTEQTEF